MRVLSFTTSSLSFCSLLLFIPIYIKIIYAKSDNSRKLLKNKIVCCQNAINNDNHYFLAIIFNIAFSFHRLFLYCLYTSLINDADFCITRQSHLFTCITD